MDNKEKLYVSFFSQYNLAQIIILIEYMTRKGGRRQHRGGNYSSATGYNDYVNGPNGDAQTGRVFNQSGPYGQDQGNGLIGAQGQHVFHSPNPGNSSLLRGGKPKKTRRGGNLGTILSQAAVPFSLLGLQQSYRRKHSNSKSRRRSRRYR